MLESWSHETLAQAGHWPDAGLVRHGLQLFQELSRPSPEDKLLATDLHAANVLRSEREPWLVIDPKPFIGEAAFDLVQHLHIAKRGSMPIQSAWSNAWRTSQKLMLSDSGSGPLPVLPPIHGRFGTTSFGRTLPERWITNDQRRSIY
jgi:hypothetical protein